MHVLSKHGVPKHVTSDRGSEFVSRFFCSLGKALDMKLHFTCCYHPEIKLLNSTYEFSAITNKTTDILCSHLQSLHTKIPEVQLEISPFFANKGYHPNLTIHPERDLASSHAKDLVVDLEELH